jgi:TonB-dependent receptor
MKITSTEVLSSRALIRGGVSGIALIAAAAATPALAAQGQTSAQTQSQTDQNANPPATTKGEIVVTGRRAAMRAADERKRRSDTIIDSVVADEAGKLPDNSITEVLQRVSGVSIVRFRSLGDPDHFSVEGSGVQVRGLTGVASRLNGRDIFSASNGRSLLWGDVTPEMMAAVDVYKDATADLIEGGTGGQIDLRTRLPFDYSGGLHFAATGSISRGDLSKANDPSISALVTDRWHTPVGDIGVLADLAYSRLTTTSQFFRMEPYFKTHIGSSDYYIPGGYDYGEERFQRRRNGLYAAVQWKPADSLLFTGTYFKSRYHNASGDWGSFDTSSTLAVDPTKSRFDSIGGLLSSPSVFQRNVQTFLPSNGAINANGNKGVQHGTDTTKDMALSFAWTPAQSPLSVSGAIQRVDSRSTLDRMDVFRTVAFPTSYAIDLTGDFPQITLPSSTTFGQFATPSNYKWTAAQPHNNDSRGRMDAANLDAEFKFDNSFFRSVKVGGRLSKRTERDLDNGYAWAALNASPAKTFADARPGDTEPHTFDDFFHGALQPPEGTLLYPSTALASQLIFPANVTEIFQLYGKGTPGRAPGFILPNDLTTFQTDDDSAYAMVRFGHDGGLNFSGNVGARVVWLKNRSSGYFQQSKITFIRDGQTLTTAATANVMSSEVSFIRLLPAANLQIDPSPTTKIRFAYNITMDLPTFHALRANGSLGVATTQNPAGGGAPNIFSNFTTTSGNPTLKPTMSQNLDLSFEWYPKRDTSAHLALFHKHITDLPIYSATQQPVTVQFTDGTSEQAFATSTDYRNATVPATVQGFEIGARTFFSMLPGFLRGFGVDANYTYIDSKNPGDQYKDISGVIHNDVPVTGLSKNNFNVALMYELKPISFRVAYSWRSRYLQTTNANGTNPTYSYWFASGSKSSSCGSSPAFCQSIPISLPVYGAAYGQVDAGIHFIVNKHLSLSLEGTNLLHATQHTLMGGYPGGKTYVRSWFQTDRTVSVGANVAF